MDRIGASLWSEFAVPFLQGCGTVEGKIFMQSFANMMPIYSNDVCLQWQQQRNSAREEKKALAQLQVSSRSFFTNDLEENVIRPIAFRLGHIPNENAIRHLSREELDMLVSNNDGCNCDFL